jgi:lysophospholipid acyltransferase (LPLAT)-like uncharacterized protein
MSTEQKSSKRGEIRGGKKQKILGSVAGWLIRLLGWTLRVELRSVVPWKGRKEPVIWLFWHGQIMPAIAAWSRTEMREMPLKALTSASRDGAVIEHALGVFGVGVARGSSSRRAASALIELKKTLDQGCDICITPDGPRGPRQTMQMGAIKLAQLTGAAVVSARVECFSSWKLKTWDRFEIPRPFSRVVIHLGSPQKISRELDEGEVEQIRHALEKELSQPEGMV